MQHDTFRHAIAALFDTVADAFSSRDLPRFRALYRFPSQVVTPQGVYALVDAEAFDRFFTPMLARLRDEQFARSAYRDLSCARLAPSLALASMCWARYRADNSVIETLGATYTLRHDEAGWGIVSLVGYPADSVPSFA
jgi:hypothetical protein